MGINVPKECEPMSSRLPLHAVEPKAVRGEDVNEVQDVPVLVSRTRDDIGTMASRPISLITRAELRSIVPYTPQHILRLEKRGLFPRRVQVGANRVAWLLSEIEEWVAARVAERKRLGS